MHTSVSDDPWVDRPYLDLRRHKLLAKPVAAAAFLRRVERYLDKEGIRGPYTAIFKASDGSAVGVSPGPLMLPANEDLLRRLLPIVSYLEDRRFLAHRGIDWIGLCRAVLTNMLALSIKQGASTLTQQLVRNLFIYPNRSWLRKVLEIIVALKIERRFSKAAIFRAYCDSVYLGPGIRGFSAGIRTYFRVSPGIASEGTLRSLAGCLRSPMRSSPLVDPVAFERRAEQVQAFFAERTAADTPKLPIRSSRFGQPRLASIIRAELTRNGWPQSGLRVAHTTIVPDVQDAMNSALRTAFDDPEVADVAGIAIDSKSGAILAEASFRAGKPTAFSPALAGRIQPGSTIKTFAFLEALEQGIVPSASFLSAPYEWVDPRFADGVWRVRNYRHHYVGQCRLGDAFVSSDNTIFARLVNRIGVAALGARLRAFDLIDDLEDHPAHVLGSVTRGVSLAQLCRAYAGLAQGFLPPFPQVIRRAEYFDGSVLDATFPRGKSLGLTALSALDYYLCRSGLTVGRSAVRGKSGTVGSTNLFAAYDDRASYVVWVGFRRSRAEWWDKGIRARNLLERMLDSLAGRTFV